MIFTLASHIPRQRPAGAGRVIAREHRAQHAPRISREGIIFREPPDMAGGPVFARKGAPSSRNHSARRQNTLSRNGQALPALDGRFWRGLLPDRDLPLSGLIRGWGGLLLTTSMARSKRSHASGVNSTSLFFASGFAMAKLRAEKIKSLARFDIPASLAREIGRFLVAWAHFEHYVQAMVWSSLELGAQESRIAVREPRVTDRLDMIADLGEFNKFEIDYVLLAEIKKKAAVLAGKRHILAHSLWIYDHAEWCALITKGSWASTQENIENYPTGSKIFEPEARPVNFQEIAEWTRQTAALIEDLKKLNDQHRPLPPPSRKKS